MEYKCLSCAQSYDSADHDLRCRVSTNGLLCSPALAEDCVKFLREPGSDAEEYELRET